MNNIAICIPTYKRQAMLKQLIVSIGQCDIDKSIINNINIVVVDNDADKTAEIVIRDLKAENNEVYGLHYYNYAVKGLANVRNELIVRALQFDPDFLVFIDDDEYVTVNWINELVKTVINNNADAARGPVLAKISNPVPKSVAKLLEREKHENNAQILLWTTGNLIVRRTSIEKYNVWFDKRFNSTGSEDTFFGIQMAKKGATIFWAANAVTYEVIPKKRTQLKWFIGRAYRGGGMYMFILKLEKDYLRIANKVLISFLYIFAGTLSTIMVLFPTKYKYWGVLKVSDGIGALAGLFNIHYREYK
jgi:glycosyltransferase involved in cell wall biosynthesis